MDIVQKHSESMVGILADPGYSFVLSLLGILKAGKGFVPLDPLAPRERMAYMLQECDVRILCIQEKYLPLVKYFPSIKHVIILDGVNNSNTVSQRSEIYDWEAIKSEVRKSKRSCHHSNDLVYMIYTSGTTGKPKGVPITHANLYPLMRWQQKHFHLNHKTKTLQTLSLSFDFGIQEVLTTILFGGTLYFAPKAELLRSGGYTGFIRSHDITMIYATPSFLASALTLDSLETLEVILLGGEILKKELIEQLIKRTSPKCLIFNGYGPTEVSINATMFLAHPARKNYPQSKSIPIGKASALNEIYLLDRHQEPVPKGVVGEIYLGGPGVSSGYWKKDELTRQKFLPNKLTDDSQGKLYKTGDIARFLDDGSIEFLGRVDEQVKIRGFRIEPTEIEHVLLEYPIIDEAVVLPLEDNGNKELHCWIVSSSDVDILQLKNFLRDRLPAYMIPSFFYTIDHIPMTLNGKLDRKNLLSNPAKHIHVPQDKIMMKPRNEIENLIVSEWQKALGVESISTEDNFFEIGGHSLMVGKVHAHLIEALGHDFPIIKIFQFPKASSLARYLQDQEELPIQFNREGRRAVDKRRALKTLRHMQQNLKKDKV